MTKSEFLALAIEHMIDEGMSIKLIAKNSVMCDGVATGGYCSGSGITVATKRSDWFETFIHEYCHVLQDLDETYEPTEDESWGYYDAWLLGKKKLSAEAVTQCTNAIRANEMDCERRVVQLIHKYNLPINEGRYIQKANSYGLFYTVAAKYRSWYKGTSPGQIDELVDMMPREFKKYWHRVPKKFEQIVKERCFKLA